MTDSIFRPLGFALTERQEIPNSYDIELGNISIISKISFSNGRIELRTNKKTRTKMILIQPGDFVISGINAHQGAVAIYEGSKPIAATIHYSSYSIDPQRANAKYIWWLLRSERFKRILNHELPGGIKTELKPKRLLPIKVPIPDVAVQLEVVEHIEKATHFLKKLHRLREISLSETNALLQSEISREMEALNVDGNLKDILIEKPRNGWSPNCDNMEGGTPVLTLTAVTGFEYKNNAYKTTSAMTDPSAHYWLQTGDLLITRSNTPELVGHVAIYDGLPSPCIYPDLMMRIPINNEKVDVNFVHLYLQSNLVRDYIKNKAKGSSPTMKKINQSNVMQIPFPTTVPLETQRSIATKLMEFKRKCMSLIEKQQASMTELDAMMLSIVNQVFTQHL